jgi:mannose-6-phosphate isomerase-like protein (cupin superfamily)
VTEQTSQRTIEESASAYQAPTGDGLAGAQTHTRLATPYESFVATEGIPVFRGIGVRNVRELTLEPWARMAGKGSFLQLDGMGGISGMYVVEIPPGGVLNTERHLYEETILVVEGRGSTEVWKRDGARPQSFEWQAGSLFSVPVNAWHRIMNAGSSRALLLGVTNAPLVMNVFANQDFVFANTFDFVDRYPDRQDYFVPNEEFEPDPASGKALRRTNIIPDIVNCELPLDNHRAPGYRLFLFQMAGNVTSPRTFIAEYPSGRYSKAHHHESGPVLICLRGKGYTYGWPRDLGTQPWLDGKEDQVKRTDYVAGGVVSAAPGGGSWWHQHFGVAQEPLRVMNVTGGFGTVLRSEGQIGDETPNIAAEIQDGGSALGYRDEDPHIRQEYRALLAKEGVEYGMPELSPQ